MANIQSTTVTILDHSSTGIGLPFNFHCKWCNVYIILSVDGVEVRKISDILIHLQREKSVGDEMVLEILRDNRTTNVTIVLQERPNGN